MVTLISRFSFWTVSKRIFTTVYDLDMNRVETIVLLKDAAAKAIYGAKAANGVVVIETRQPKAGKMRISYQRRSEPDDSRPDRL